MRRDLTATRGLLVVFVNVISESIFSLSCVLILLFHNLLQCIPLWNHVIGPVQLERPRLGVFVQKCDLIFGVLETLITKDIPRALSVMRLLVVPNAPVCVLRQQTLCIR